MNWKLPRTPTAILPCALGVVIIAGLLSLLGDGTAIRVGSNFLVAIVLVLGIQIFSGNTGIVSFGHVAFMGVGAYVAAWLSIPPNLKDSGVLGSGLQLTGLPPVIAEASVSPVVALLAGGLVAGACAFVVGLVFTRMKENAIAMATIALLVIFQVVASNWQSVTNGSVGLYSIPASISLWSAAGLAVLAIVVALLFRYSKVGLMTRGTREDSLAAAALGADVRRLRLISWTLSCVVMGVGGAAWALMNSAFTPMSFGFPQTFALLAMLVVGGLESVSGAITGALLLAALNEFLRRSEAGVTVNGYQVILGAGYSYIIVSVIILVVLIRRPMGIVGSSEWGDRIRLRLAASKPSR